MGLHLAAVVLFQYHTGCMIHVPGKCVPHIITCLADYMSPDDHMKLAQYQGLVVKHLTKGGEVVDDEREKYRGIVGRRTARNQRYCF